ncbi:hypothetical protein AXF42_Ash009237 [Apostasia shenzhenica]|uniref:Uncharacterized protein n=1 Tax=Apostasia shenzhenica TaxID=1088818 RepID=A0A2I0B3I3_9ASPA|nr:hypothetical protein AXF42_Ash009237 [Apostasia shenzhenica]
MNGVLGTSLCLTLNTAASGNRSSKTEPITHAATVVNAGIASKNRAIAADLADTTSASKNEVLNSSLCKENGGQLLRISPSPPTETSLATICLKSSKIEEFSQVRQVDPAAVGAGFFSKHGAAAVGNANNINTSEFGGLESNLCKEDDVQMLEFSSSQQVSTPECSQGIISSHLAARGVATTFVTACDITKKISSENASGPLRQSTVRQNATASSPQISAGPSKHSSHLHLQTSEYQQAPQLELHASRATHFNQQGKVLQQHTKPSNPPKQ